MLASTVQARKGVIKILILGDSTVAGYRMDPADAVPAQLEGFLRRYDPRIQVINGGTPGNTTADGRKRLDSALKRHKPDIVILALGNNDILRGLAPKLIQENLDAILTRLKESGTGIVLTAVEAPSNFPAGYQRAVKQIYINLANTYNVALYPFLLERVRDNSEFMTPDGTQPNDKGAKLIARDLAIYLVQKINFKAL